MDRWRFYEKVHYVLMRAFVYSNFSTISFRNKEFIDHRNDQPFNFRKNFTRIFTTEKAKISNRRKRHVSINFGIYVTYDLNCALSAFAIFINVK